MLASATCPTAEAGEQPGMEAARDRVQAAHAYLQKAEHNKGGHRAKAMQLT